MLGAMYPNIRIPEPVACYISGWNQDPLFRGSYSNWPVSFFQEHHDNIRAPVNDRLWFTGEHCSQKYFVCGFLPTRSTLADWTGFLGVGFPAWSLGRRNSCWPGTRCVY